VIAREIRADVPPLPSWEGASCAGMDTALFFPDQERDAGPALAVCRTCWIRERCLSYALEAGEVYGVWGGLLPIQRRNLALERRRLLAGSPA
jgi:WhiB family redox-sensing transcriptional regulator